MSRPRSRTPRWAYACLVVGIAALIFAGAATAGQHLGDAHARQIEQVQP